MVLVGSYEDDECLPEYGCIVMRGRNHAGQLPESENGLLGELATDALSGTVATAGDGWLRVQTG